MKKLKYRLKKGEEFDSDELEHILRMIPAIVSDIEYRDLCDSVFNKIEVVDELKEKLHEVMNDNRIHSVDELVNNILNIVRQQ